MDNDLTPDPNEIDTTDRNRELDRDILRPGIEIAGLKLRHFSAGDLAVLMDAGVGLVFGRTDSIAMDVGSILFAQSTPREEVRRLSADKDAFRARVFAFLDEYEPGVFTEATPRIMELVEHMSKGRAAQKGTAGTSGAAESKKNGRRGG